MKKYLFTILGLLLSLPLMVSAVQVSVPSAPGSGYLLVSTSTGNYLASSTLLSNFITSSFASSSFLLLDQTSPQTVINGAPIFSQGAEFGTTGSLGLSGTANAYLDYSGNLTAENIYPSLDETYQIGSSSGQSHIGSDRTLAQPRRGQCDPARRIAHQPNLGLACVPQTGSVHSRIYPRAGSLRSGATCTAVYNLIQYKPYVPTACRRQSHDGWRWGG